MLPSDAVMEEHTPADIIVSGHSRMPVQGPGNRSVFAAHEMHDQLIVNRSSHRWVGQAAGPKI